MAAGSRRCRRWARLLRAGANCCNPGRNATSPATWLSQVGRNCASSALLWRLTRVSRDIPVIACWILDGSHTIDTVVEPSVEDKAYTLRSLDLTNFADGGLHTIVFEFSAPNLGKSSSFNVGDITLGIPCPDASPTPTPTPTPSPGPTPTCTSGNKLADSSLEASTGDSFPITNPNWDSTSTHFISSLCSPDVCGSVANGQSVPRTGKYWAWFGGSEGPENGTLQQRVVIPSGAGVFLGYYLKVSKVYSPFNDRLTVIVDGEVLQTIIEPATDALLRSACRMRITNPTEQRRLLQAWRPGSLKRYRAAWPRRAAPA